MHFAVAILALLFHLWYTASDIMVYSMPDGLPLQDPNHMRILRQQGENTGEFLNKYGN